LTNSLQRHPAPLDWVGDLPAINADSKNVGRKFLNGAI
jgi:hypothetical protein